MDNQPPVKLSRKMERKQVRAFRREAAKAGKAYSDTLMKNIGVFNEALKKRPKYVPARIWNWFAGIFIDIEKLKRVVAGDKGLQ